MRPSPNKLVKLSLLHHIESRHAALKTSSAVLRPDGADARDTLSVRLFRVTVTVSLHLATTHDLLIDL
jgi:hypothetical protein